MKINVYNTTALIVDYQERLMPAIHHRDKLAKRSAILIKGLRLLDIPMMITQQYTKGLGMSAPFVYEAAGTKAYFEKMSFSCLGDPQIVRQLQDANRKNVIVCGIEAHICVLQTCLDLLEQGYRPLLVLDCISSRKKSDLKMAVSRALAEGVTVTSYESVLFELMQRSGGDTFKQISQLVK